MKREIDMMEWMINHTYYDEFEMGAIDLLLDEMGEDLPDAQKIIEQIRKNIND